MKKEQDRNPVRDGSRKIAEQMSKLYDAHKRALIADLRRKTKGRDGWTPWQVTEWLVREIKDCSTFMVDPWNPSNIEHAVRQQVAIELLSDDWRAP